MYFHSLSGTLPFYADNPDDFLELVLHSSFSFPESEWAEVSEGGARRNNLYWLWLLFEVLICCCSTRFDSQNSSPRSEKASDSATDSGSSLDGLLENPIVLKSCVVLRKHSSDCLPSISTFALATYFNMPKCELESSRKLQTFDAWMGRDG